MKQYWVPILFGVGTTIALLGVSLSYALERAKWVSYIDIALGLILVWWGVRWSKYVSQGEMPEPALNVSLQSPEHKRIVKYKNFSHEVIPDKAGPYFLGDNVALSVRIKNLLDKPQTGKFFYFIYLPDGMYLPRPLYPIDFEPHEEKLIKLGDPVFCAFLGIFRLVIVTGNAEEELINAGAHDSQVALKSPITFQALFAGYSRDKEGYELEKRMVNLTAWIRGLTVVLVALTIATIVLILR